MLDVMGRGSRTFATTLARLRDKITVPLPQEVQSPQPVIREPFHPLDWPHLHYQPIFEQQQQGYISHFYPSNTDDVQLTVRAGKLFLALDTAHPVPFCSTPDELRVFLHYLRHKRPDEHRLILHGNGDGQPAHQRQHLHIRLGSQQHVSLLLQEPVLASGGVFEDVWHCSLNGPTWNSLLWEMQSVISSGNLAQHLPDSQPQQTVRSLSEQLAPRRRQSNG